MGVQNPVLNTSWSPVNLSKRERKARHLDAMLDIYRDSPETGATDIPRQLGIGRSTVYTYISELEGAGQIRKNGHGVEVLEASA
jgi:DNA-binding IclR family transcriptional regulator